MAGVLVFFWCPVLKILACSTYTIVLSTFLGGSGGVKAIPRTACCCQKLKEGFEKNDLDF